MTHEDAGHYSLKHPGGTSADPAIAAALRETATDGRLPCVAAHQAADAFHVAPAEVGKTADLLELRIVECQMGLFGYSPEKRTVKPADTVPEELRDRLEGLTHDGRISCARCWELAETLGIDKMTVSGACEGLGLKVKPCQLGAF